MTTEINFDGLVGPTHNYAGLSFGNVASAAHADRASNPREAALQGLGKIKALVDMGLPQAVLPPHERPHVKTLRALGFTGDDPAVIAAAFAADPNLVLNTSSASPMWTANAATVSPSADTADGRVHFTPANLTAMYHRSIEHEVTGRVLRAIFPAGDNFAHHAALPGQDCFGDEGAANHTRFHGGDGPGVEFFVFGKYAFSKNKPVPKQFPGRQTYEASTAVARRHGLAPERTVFAQQNPDLIDAGVFHNDVISVGNGSVLFHYEDAFVDTARVLTEIRDKLASQASFETIEVKAADVPLSDVVDSYLFNSQLVTRAKGGMMLILPTQARDTPSVKAWLDGLLSRNTSIRAAHFFDLRQSMSNGGGPACLRLRVALTVKERAAANPAVFMDDALHARLVTWVETHYRDRLAMQDLADPALLDECRTALDDLTGILDLGPVYDFQRN